jgi:two-component system, chemotaxis family, protein-glutamate methylesterase/glutaminase
MQNPIRVLVVDDSGLFRRALSAEIEKDPRFKIVGMAADGRAAIEKVRELKPDVVTLDVEMPVMSGIEALRTIVTESTSSVIMVSALTENGAKVTVEALAIGAIDFIPKTRATPFIHEKLLVVAEASRAKARQRLPQKLHTSAPLEEKGPPRPASRHAIRIVVIGSSTGGPQALQTVFAGLPKQLPVPVVVAQHMPPHFTEALAKRLNDNCPPRVVHAGHGDNLQPNCIYIAPGGGTMRISPTEIQISQEEGGHLYKPSVDILAASVNAAFGRNTLAVLLTGMGSDGAREMHNTRKLGGYTLAQNQATSAVFGMPRALIEAGGADEVLPIAAIGPRIAALLGSH